MGGLDALSEAQKSLIRRAAALEIELEALEGRLSRGEPVDLDILGASAVICAGCWRPSALAASPAT